MKKLLLLTFVLLSNSTFAQQKDTVGLNTPFVNGEVTYQKVFNAPGKPAVLLFSNAQLWFIKHYKTINNIQIQDEAVDRVVGKGVEALSFKGVLGINDSYDVHMTIQIDCKNGKYRIRIYNIAIETEDVNKVKNFINAEQLMYSLLGDKSNNTTFTALNPFNKNQSKRALQNLNTLIENVIWSVDQTMNYSDNF